MYFPDADDFANEFDGLATAPELGIDLETTDLDPRDGAILLVSVSDGCKTIVGRPSPQLTECLGNYGGLWIAHNAKFEYAWLRHHFGVVLQAPYCTQVADHVLRCGEDNVRGTSSLGECIWRYNHYRVDKTLQKSFVGVDPATWEPTEEQIRYAAMDASALPGLKKAQKRKLDEADLWETMRLEMAVLPVLAEMERRGMAVDVPAWRAMLADLDVQLRAAEESLVEILTPPLVLVRARLYQAAYTERQQWESEYAVATQEIEYVADKHQHESRQERRRWIQAQQREWKETHPNPGVPHLAEGPINLRSRNQKLDALLELGVELDDLRLSSIQDYGRKNEDEKEVMDSLMEWSALQKLQSAFGENILEKVRDGRIYPSFNQLVRTGRLSCANPNLQQMPAGRRGGAASELAARLRACFVAPEGRRLVVADYSSIEYRIAAELYDERDALRELGKGKDGDPHRATAARIFGVPVDEVTGDQRQAAKTINYAVIYGISAYGLAPRLDVTIDEAKALLKAWNEANPNMSAGLAKEGTDAMKLGCSRTALGRRRLYSLPKRDGNDYEARKVYNRFANSIKRKAANQPIQGMSADITKIALARIHKALRGLDAFLINCVHDEVIVEASEQDAERAAEIVTREMVAAARTFLERVPVDADVHIGETWTH